MPEVSENNQIIWHIPAWRPLRFLKWPSENEVVVLQPASGDIHLVSEAVASVLDLLQRSALTIPAIMAYIESGDVENPGITSGAELDSRLLRPLQYLGLIETTIEPLAGSVETSNT